MSLNYFSDWMCPQIGDVADVIAGGTPSAGNSENFADPGQCIAWLTPADLSKYDGKYISHGARDLSKLGYESSSAKLMPKGSVLFSSRAPIGYVVIAANDIATNQGFKNFVFTKDIDSTYAYYFLKSIRELAESLGTGTTFKEISGSTAKTLPFVLPPLAEQQQIAQKLDELLAQVDTLKTRLDAIPKILKRFRQSVLAAAVSGRLTEEWRGVNQTTPAIFSIGEIENSRISILGKKSPSKVHLHSEEYEIPNTWQWVSLDLLASKIVDGTHHTPTYIDNGIPFISVKDIKDGRVSFENTKFISKAEHVELTKRCNPEGGDLLITKSGTIGRTAIVPEDKEFSLFVSVALIKPISSLVNIQFIDIALQKWVNEIDVSSRIVGTAIKNLHLQDMRVLAIPFAPIEEQTEIVRRVEQLFTYADQIEQRVKDAQARVNHLTQSILAKAFRGELTAEWRAQNPELISGENSAAALLERIKAERDKLSKAPKVKKNSEKKAAGKMSKQIIKVIEALRLADKPLSGQQLLVAAGYSNDSSTDLLEQFFLDIREAVAENKTIVKVKRTSDGQDWFALTTSNNK